MKSLLTILTMVLATGCAAGNNAQVASPVQAQNAKVVRVCNSLVITGLSQAILLNGAAPTVLPPSRTPVILPNGDYDYGNGCNATVADGQITSNQPITPNVCVFSCGESISLKTCADGHQQLVNWYSAGTYTQYDLDYANGTLVKATEECQ